MRSLPRWISAASLALAACSPEAERVYVPADGYPISVQISPPDEARVGEWIVLSAQRRDGTDRRRKVRFEKPGACRVWALTAYPTEGKSNMASIRIR